jgi:hypothetical protein
MKQGLKEILEHAMTKIKHDRENTMRKLLSQYGDKFFSEGILDHDRKVEQQEERYKELRERDDDRKID